MLLQQYYNMSDVVHPIFLSCCSHTTDPYWIDIFTKLAYNQTPYGIILNEEYISCKIPDRNFTYKINNDIDSKIMYEELYVILKDKYGLESDSDRMEKSVRYNNASNTQNIDTIQNWTEIRKRSIKDRFIYDFAREIGKECSLNDTQVKDLVHNIYNGFITKAITNKDIEFSNGKILSIKGISVSESKELELNFEDKIKDKKIKPTVIRNYEVIGDNWTKLLKQLSKSKISVKK